MIYKVKTTSAEETNNIGYILGQAIQPGDTIALSGNLGAGKTAFTIGLAKGLGIKETITSPTFTIVNEYKGRIPFFHFDVYRVYDEDELNEIGFAEYFYRNGACCIEWADLIPQMLPEYRIEINIVNIDGEPDSRVVSAEIHGCSDELKSALNKIFAREESL